MRNETFGRLLKAGIGSIATCDGKTAPAIEEELGQKIGVSAASIQRYKAGHLPPEPRTVQILAEACVRRGHLNRNWLQAFLRAAHYPASEQLLEKLCPIGPARPRPPRIYENLPAPTYSQFVMRAQVFAEVVEGLSKRSAAVLIVGFGGNGKTSLAREVAARCLQDDGDVPRFDAVVWISDKDHPATTNLSIVLDEIARTLDYPGYTQFEHEEKRREVEQLLRRQRVLVVIDNFETITDGALLSWLLNLPEPSKALITTREYRREFRRGGWPVDLRGMTEAEARELITERVRVLKIEKLVGDLSHLEPLLAATGGNPKAIEMTMGLLKYERRPLRQVVDDLYAARGELFDDLFTRAWALLDEAARRVLLVMTFFPGSASGEALRVTADVQGLAFDRPVERLNDLALLDVQQEDLSSPPRYTLHPLVRAFAHSQLTNQNGFENGSRKRWVDWYIQLASRVGYCWNNLERLELLDPEQETVSSVIQWTFHNRFYSETVQMAKDCAYYYDVRGLWNQEPSISHLWADAARYIGNLVEEAAALAYHIQSLCKQDRMLDAQQSLIRLQQVMEIGDIPNAVTFECQFAIALFRLANNDFIEARKLLETMVEQGAHLAMHKYVTSCQGVIGVCLYREERLDDARELFYRALSNAVHLGAERSVIYNKTKIAMVEIDVGNIDEATRLLVECHRGVTRYPDRRRLAEIYHLYARLHTLRSEFTAARTAFAEAIDLFERLGMRRELAEAREELARLEAMITSSSEPAPA